MQTVTNHGASLIVLIMICFMQVEAKFGPLEAFDATLIIDDKLTIFCQMARRESYGYNFLQ